LPRILPVRWPAMRKARLPINFLLLTLIFLGTIWERSQLKAERGRGEDNVRLRTSVLQPQCHRVTVVALLECKSVVIAGFVNSASRSEPHIDYPESA
jgi:hypothetical protein